MTIKHTTLTLSALLLATGCASYHGTVLPAQGGNFQAITPGKTKGGAYKMAQADAERTCKKETGNKRFYTLKNDSEYTGVTIDRGEGGTARSVIAGAVEFAAALKKDENYEVTMFFRCAASEPQTAAVDTPWEPATVAVPEPKIETTVAPAPASTAFVIELEPQPETTTSLSGRPDIDAIVAAALANR